MREKEFKLYKSIKNKKTKKYKNLQFKIKHLKYCK